ncbi:MAG: imidazolonepropionase-like domain-containing protein, partial [Steroidobacteraceae bacterium]
MNQVPANADLLIEARWVLPIAPSLAPLPHHAVAIARGRIAAVGPTDEIASRFTARERIALSDHALLPGFVNSHARVGRLLLRGRGRAVRAAHAADDWTGADLVRDSAQLAAAEMLLSGITAFGTRDAWPEEVARVAAAARLRAAIGLPLAERVSEWAHRRRRARCAHRDAGARDRAGDRAARRPARHAAAAAPECARIAESG